MKPVALEYGILADRFWHMTLGEILDQITANHAIREQNFKERALISYQESVLASYAHHKPQDMPSIAKTWPGVFDDEQPRALNDGEVSGEEEWQADQIRLLKQFQAIEATNKRKEIMNGD